MRAINLCRYFNIIHLMASNLSHNADLNHGGTSFTCILKFLPSVISANQSGVLPELSKI